MTAADLGRNNSPSALELKCIEVWLISCTLFVFLALVEYFIVLFGMRYDKHWRHKKHNLDGNGGAPNRPSLFGSNKVHVTSGNDVATEEDSVSVIAKAQHPTSQQQMLTTNNGPAQVVTSTGKLRFRLVAKHVILYCGSPRGILDQVSLALFPLCFILFSVMYWISYITESRRKSMAAVI